MNEAAKPDAPNSLCVLTCPSPFTDTVRWSSQGPPATAGVTPAPLLIAAHADLADAMGTSIRPRPA